MFSVTYEIVTQESAEQGDFEESGFVCENVSLREAVESLFETRTSQCDGVTSIEASGSVLQSARSVTVHNGMEYLTGAYESRAIHFPDNMTGSSRARLVRLLEGES